MHTIRYVYLLFVVVCVLLAFASVAAVAKRTPISNAEQKRKGKDAEADNGAEDSLARAAKLAAAKKAVKEANIMTYEEYGRKLREEVMPPTPETTTSDSADDEGGERTLSDDEDLPIAHDTEMKPLRREISRSLSPSLSPSASVLARKKAFSVRTDKFKNIPLLTMNQLELLADQVFDGIVTEIHYHDHRPFKNSTDKFQREFVDRYYRLTVLVTTVVFLRDEPMMMVSHSKKDIKKIKAENLKHGGVEEHAHKVSEGDLVDVMMWEAYKRPDYGIKGGFMKGFELGFVLFPKRPDPNIEYRFFTSGITHRMHTYRNVYPTAGKDLPAFEAMIPNGVQIVKDDGTIDEEPMRQRHERSKSVRLDL